MFRAEIWQDGAMVAAVEAPTYADMEREASHYAMIYGQDGPVEVYFSRPPPQPQPPGADESPASSSRTKSPKADSQP